MKTLIPDYLNIDFSTFISRVKEQISESDILKDINYEGSNISILIELFAYIAEMNTYYLNKLAKNQFIDTADNYENIHRLSTFIGYNPKGYLASNGTINITLYGNGTFLKDKTLTLQKHSIVRTSDGINFVVMKDVVSDNPHDPNYSYEDYNLEFNNVPVKQGEFLTLTYSYDDIVDYKILLPFYNYAYDNDLNDEIQTIELSVGEDKTPWSRIENFYDNISGWIQENEDEIIINDKVYRFLYNKYQQYYIEFSPFRSVPGENDAITVKILKTLGKDGNVKAGAINDYDINNFILIDGSGNVIQPEDLKEIVINNPVNTYGGRSPESVDEIKTSAKSIVNRQFRTVTKDDYKSYLETSNLVSKAVIWGEQEQNPDGGNIFDYNKIYISMIPPGDDFDSWSNFMGLEQKTNVVPYIENNEPPIIWEPTPDENNEYYTKSFKEKVWRFLEPLKMIGTHEFFVKPEFIYFGFKFSLKINTNYNYNDVVNDFKDKLLYYFHIKNRNFGETISYTDIINTITDPEFIDNSDINNVKYFLQTKGILNIIIRDISYYNGLEWTNNFYEKDNNEKNYPQFEDDISYYDEFSISKYRENQISDIKLSYNQFPFLERECIYVDQII